MKNLFQLAMVFVGTVIGAGFASGRELSDFFLRYRTTHGLYLSCALLFLVCMAVLRKVWLTDVSSAKEYFSDMLPPLLQRMIESISLLFLMTGYIVMIAGTGALGQQLFSLPPLVGITAMSILCFAVLSFGADGLIRLSTLLTPLMIVGTVWISQAAAVPTGSFFPQSRYAAAVLYASYNVITIVAVLAPLRPLVTSGRIPIAAAGIGALTLLVMALLLCGVIVSPSSELPVLDALRGQPQMMEWVYGTILFFAMLTTAISSGFGAMDMLKQHFGGGQRRYLLLVTAIGFLLGFCGFSSLVGTLYPLFGILGLFSMTVILADWLKTEIVCYFKKKGEKRSKM